jgi:hydrogenase expression/formation protein HypC
MCLAIPGRIEQLFEQDGLRMATVNFNGIRRSVCVQYTSEAKVDDFVLVHVGFAISNIDKEKAEESLKGLTMLSIEDELGA